jgi:23S rRNA maturation-related 3'-5' exoribonuclease YhaM
MELQERIDFFKEELSFIFDGRIREFTKLCLATAPDYIFSDCPASSTGKHHPLNELSWDGTLIHTKKVTRVAYVLSRALDIEEKRDLMIASALIHDLVKRGWDEEKAIWTVKEHPQLAGELVDKVQMETQLLELDEYETIRSCVFFHYGPWTIQQYKKPMENFSLEELCVYISDYVASKKFLDIQYKGEVDA